MKAELLLSQVQTPGARCACMQQASILQQQQQQKQQRQKLTEAFKKGNPGTPQIIANFAISLTFEGPHNS